MKTGEGRALAGVIAIDKPEGPTSHDIVRRVRRALNTRRVGHCGTLDPLATGLLLVCVGRFTRLSDWLTGADKQYMARFRLGATSDTADAQGQITALDDGPVPTRQQVEEVIAQWLGTVEQVPPSHSAIKVDGVRSYKRARRQEAVELPARSITVSRFDVDEYEYPLVSVTIDCSKGTYIRSLARDVGDSLGCGAYVDALRRTRSGAVDVADAVALDEIDDLVAAAPDVRLSRLWIDPVEALRDRLPAVHVDVIGARDFTHGRMVETGAGAGEVAVCFGEELLGIGRIDKEQLHAVKVLSEPTP